MKNAIYLCSLLILATSCLGRKEREAEPEIPEATTPYTCDSFHYSVRLYENLPAERFYLTPTGHFLMPYGHKTNLVSKTDTNLNIIWQRTLGDWNGSYFVFEQRGKDTWYAQYSNGDSLVFALVDEELNAKRQFSERWYTGCSVHDFANGRGQIIVKNRVQAGYTTYNSSIKAFDHDLNILWTYVYDNDSEPWNDPAVKYFSFDEEYHYFGGEVFRLPGTDQQSELPYLLKLDNDGNKQWEHIYTDATEPGFSAGEIYHIKKSGDILYAYMTATKKTGGNNGRNVIYHQMKLHIDATSGELKDYEVVEEKLDLQSHAKPEQVYYPANDGGYFTLHTVTTTETGNDIVVTKYSKDSTEEWFNSYVYPVDEAGLGVAQPADGTIYLLARVKFYDGEHLAPVQRSCIIKADDRGNTCY